VEKTELKSFEQLDLLIEKIKLKRWKICAGIEDLDGTKYSLVLTPDDGLKIENFGKRSFLEYDEFCNISFSSHLYFYFN